MKIRSLISCFMSLTLILTLIYTYNSYNYAFADSPQDEFASSGYGFRQNFTGVTCADKDNIISDSSCNSKEYWMNCVSNDGFAEISFDEAYEGSSSLKVSGTGLYRKTVSGLKTETFYYLSVWGKSYGEPIGDINFGFMDGQGYQLNNPLTENEQNYEIYNSTRKQPITIQCQDGSWYNRIYKFNTGSNTTLDFFVTGTLGEMYLDDIRIFECDSAISTFEKIPDLTIHSTDVNASVCDDDHNLFTNGNFDYGSEFWEDFKGYGDFVEVVCSDGNNMLHYMCNNNDYYYLPTVTVNANVEYTCSFWVKYLNGSGAKCGIVALNNPKGFIYEIPTAFDEYGIWKKVSVSFTVYTSTRISVAIFDNGGELVFDNIRLFKSENGYSAVNSLDQPLGGSNFEDSLLGSNGVIGVDKPSYFASQLSYNDSSKALIDYSDYNWMQLGQNLIPDSKVACFQENIYGTYFDPQKNDGTIINPIAWWDKPADYYNGHIVDPPLQYCSSAKNRGFITNDILLSHTLDGSGSIRVPKDSGVAYCMPMPRMENNSYYIISFWINISTKEWKTISFNKAFGTDNRLLEVGSVWFDTGWKRVTILAYTASNVFATPFVQMMTSSAYMIDELSVYKLSIYNGAACYKNKRLVILGDMNNDNELDSLDLTILKKSLILSSGLSVGDANNDNNIDIKDLVRIKKSLTK